VDLDAACVMPAYPPSETSGEECPWLALSSSPLLEAGREVNAHPPPGRTPALAVAAAQGATQRPILVWYRGHDLRIDDHAAFCAAAETGMPVVPVYVWNPQLPWMSKPGRAGRWRLRESLLALDREFAHRYGEDARLVVLQGSLVESIVELARETNASAVYFNRCYDIGAAEVDRTLEQRLAVWNVELVSFKSELLVEPWELAQDNGEPFNEFHPFMEKWLAFPKPPPPVAAPLRLQTLPGLRQRVSHVEIHELELVSDLSPEWCAQMECMWPLVGERAAWITLSRFLRERYPKFGRRESRCALDGTSRLSMHVRFGEISPRQLYAAIMADIVSDAPSALSLGNGIPAHSREQNGYLESPHRISATPHSMDATAIATATAAVPGYQPQRAPMFPLRVQVNRPRGSSGTTYFLYDHEDDDDDDNNNNNGDEADDNDDGGRGGTDQAAPRSTRHALLNRGRHATAGEALAANTRTHTDAADAQQTISAVKAFLKNMCLREFAYHLLFHNPQAFEEPLLPEFRAFPWRWNDQSMLEVWRSGQTGYPIIDAAIRELRTTGYLHNRIRFMIAGFLTKYLLIPWQHGLRFLYDHVLDGDIACQTLGWQWTAGCHTDAFPFACIVNPITFGLREDPHGEYVKRWVPELAALPTCYVHRPWRAPASVLAQAGIALGSCYAHPVVDSRTARARALDSMDLMRRVFVLRQPTRSLWSLIDLQQPQLWLEQSASDSDDSGMETFSFTNGTPYALHDRFSRGSTTIIEELAPTVEHNALQSLSYGNHSRRAFGIGSVHTAAALVPESRQRPRRGYAPSWIERADAGASEVGAMQPVGRSSGSSSQLSVVRPEQLNEFLRWVTGPEDAAANQEQASATANEQLRAWNDPLERVQTVDIGRELSPITTSAQSVTLEPAQPQKRRRGGQRNPTRASMLGVAEREEILAAIALQPNQPFHCFARFLMQHYRFTPNTVFGPHTDFVRLRALKAELAAAGTSCEDSTTSERSRSYERQKSHCLGHVLTVAKMKHFLRNTLGLEVTGQWDRRAHGGVRGPYAYGLTRCPASDDKRR
jgi:deoxyribodipyrimidine photolyase